MKFAILVIFLSRIQSYTNVGRNTVQLIPNLAQSFLVALLRLGQACGHATLVRIAGTRLAEYAGGTEANYPSDLK